MSSRAVQKRARRPVPLKADADAPRSPKPRDAGRAPVLLLIVAVVLTFWPVCIHEFTDWDDDLNVTQNAHLYNPSAHGVLYFWAHAYAHEYIPLSYTAWWALARIARLETPDASGALLNPYVFHTANLLIHLAAAWVVYRLLQVLTGWRWPACAGALLFALHPLQVEPVAWVTGLKDLLAGLFSVVAVWQYVMFARASAPSPDKTREPARAAPSGRASRALHYAAATAALAAAILAKPSAVAVPAIAAAIDLWLLRRPLRRIVIDLLPWAALAGVFAVYATRVMPDAGAQSIGVLTRAGIACDSIAFYLGKVLLPRQLAPIYPHSIREVLAGGWIRLAWLMPAGLALLAWVFRRRAPWVAAAAAVFVAALLPASGLVSFEYQVISTVADRYAYVALLGPALALALALSTDWVRRSPTRARSAAIVCVAVLVLLAGVSFAQTRYWHDSTALFRRAIEVSPSSDVAYCNLASDALAAGRLEEAEQLAQKAIDIGPNRAQNYVTHGIVLQQLGRHAKAGAAFLDAVQRDPSNPTALINLAIELAQAGQVDKAVAICQGALQIAPDFAEAHRCMATLLASQPHREQDAVAQAEIAVKLSPNDPRAHVTLGQTLERAGRRAEAAAQFAVALSMAPTSVDAREGLARTGPVQRVP